MEWNHNINFPDIETILIYVVDKDAALHIAKIESLIYYDSKRSFLFFFQLYKSVRVIDKLKKKRIIYKKENLYCTLSFFQTFNIENIFSFFFLFILSLDDLLNLKFGSNLIEIFYIIDLIIIVFFNIFLISQKLIVSLNKVFQIVKNKKKAYLKST